MSELFGKILATGIGISVAAWLLDGIQLGGPEDHWPARIGTVLGVATILALLNKILKPLVTFLSLPLLILTLGLFWVIISAAMLWLTSRLAGSLGLAFHVENFWWQSVLGGLIVSIIAGATEPVFTDSQDDS